MYAQEQMRGEFKGGVVAGTAGWGNETQVKDQAVRQREIPAAIIRLNKAAANMEDSLNELENRLQGVMRPQMPEPATTGAQVASVPPQSSHASDIWEQGNRIERLADRIQDLMRRLEV